MSNPYGSRVKYNFSVWHL